MNLGILKDKKRRKKKDGGGEGRRKEKMEGIFARGNSESLPDNIE